MTNEELKKKIAQIISEYCCPSGKTHKQLYGDDRMCYSKMNFAECNPITECTDALIAAGIGDVKERKFEADHYWSMWQGSLVELERAERRAEVVERALRNITERASCNICDNFSCRYYEGINFDYNAEDCIKWWLAQAEKELAEEGKE